MDKKFSHPYMRPLYFGFENRKYLRESAIILKFLNATILRRVRQSQDSHWVFIHEGSKKAKPKAKMKSWMPKIYLCVSPRDFWPLITDLIYLSRKNKFKWKFSKHFKTFAKPDKIVMYADNLAELKRIIRIVRPFMRNMNTHRLDFAASSVEMGLEKHGHGIFVGTDPGFLKASWRHYRWAIDEGVIKPNKKHNRLSKELKTVLRKLNISVSHQGPISLSPPVRNNKTVWEIWQALDGQK